MTSEQLFLQYAFPCAEGRVMLKKIDSIDYEKLKLLLRENGNPEQKFLNHCFKDADEQLRAFAEKHGLEITKPVILPREENFLAALFRDTYSQKDCEGNE